MRFLRRGYASCFSLVHLLQCSQHANARVHSKREVSANETARLRSHLAWPGLWSMWPDERYGSGLCQKYTL